MYNIEIVLWNNKDHERHSLEMIKLDKWQMVLEKLNKFQVLAQQTGKSVTSDIDDYRSNFGALRWSFTPAENEVMEFTLHCS